MTRPATFAHAENSEGGMLGSAAELRGYQLEAGEGPIGRVRDLFFDETSWEIKYLEVDTGGWLSGRRLLLSPACCGAPDRQRRSITTTLSRSRIESGQAPEVATLASEFRQMEFAAYCAWPDYWVPDPVYGAGGAYGAAVAPERALELEEPHLRSAREAVGYRIQAADGEVGHLEDLLVEDAAWVVRYLVVDTRNWLPGRKVLLAPEWVRQLDWERMTVVTVMARDRIRQAPAYHPSEPVSRDYEARLYEHYGAAKYWDRRG